MAGSNDGNASPYPRVEVRRRVPEGVRILIANERGYGPMRSELVIDTNALAAEVLQELVVALGGDVEYGVLRVYIPTGTERVTEHVNKAQAELTIMLQRTVDPSLELLRAAADAKPVALGEAIDRSPHLDAALAVADAILGPGHGGEHADA